MERENFKNMKVWQDAMELTTDIYKATADFPESEQYGLTNQIRNSAVNLPSKIAAGSARHDQEDFCDFLEEALSHTYELETQTLLASELKIMDYEDASTIIRQLSALQEALDKMIEEML